jgi:hypothetical protein
VDPAMVAVNNKKVSKKDKAAALLQKEKEKETSVPVVMYKEK